MPNIIKALKEEIQRLARKEIKTVTAILHKDNVALKRAAADLKRRIAVLERENRQLLKHAGKPREEAAQGTGNEVDKSRITAKMIRAIRAKLNLSQAELAVLLGVNAQSVYQWEHKEGRLTFRGNTRAAIVALRKMKRKEVHHLLEQKSKK